MKVFFHAIPNAKPTHTFTIYLFLCQTRMLYPYQIHLLMTYTMMQVMTL